jgi:uncharacterized protein with beta-barrel porin domain
VNVEPFAGLAFVSAQTSRFCEPGPAGLRARVADHNTWFSTLGARAGTQWDLGRHGVLAAEGMLGWRHAFGNTTPSIRMRLSGSPHFSVGGAGAAQDALLLNAGLKWQRSMTKPASDWATRLKSVGARVTMACKPTWAGASEPGIVVGAPRNVALNGRPYQCPLDWADWPCAMPMSEGGIS